MEQKELDNILKLHRMWLYGENGGQRANLSKADLSYTNLSDVILSKANLNNADLRFADLNGADLNNADLSYANLNNADLSNVNLNNANLSDSSLNNTDLNNADLSDTNLRYADLSYANLNNANLSDAVLSYTDLRNAILSGANLLYMLTREISGYTVLAKQMDTTIKNRLTQYWVELDIVTCGCQQLSLEDFEDRVKETREGEILEKYMKLIGEFKEAKAEYGKKKSWLRLQP